MTSAMRLSAAAGSGAAVVEGAAGDAIGAGAFAALSAGLRSKKNSNGSGDDHRRSRPQKFAHLLPLVVKIRRKSSANIA